MKTPHIAAILFTFASASCLIAAEGVPSPPGVVIDHCPASTEQYIGSPAIAVLPNGDYVASHDLFGPKSTEHTVAVTRVFRSKDHGQTWGHLTDIDGAFWSSLFVHRDRLYLLGMNKHYGFLVIRRSDDGGQTWTEPKDQGVGLLRDDGKYHTAPVPVVFHNGRIYRAVEDFVAPGFWGISARARMLSASEDADLLQASSWTLGEPVAGNTAWLDGRFGGCIEGNAVVAPQGDLVNILRVQFPDYEEKAAIVHVSADGTKASFDPAKDFCDFPGGSKKFTIRFDPQTKLYWTLSNYVPPEQRGSSHPSATRNTLALCTSPDLRVWTVQKILLAHPDQERHGFQYVDWLFDGDDLIAVSRTAFDDEEGNAHNFHDANFLTFHRIRGFRQSIP